MIINRQSAMTTLTRIRETAIKVGIYEHVTIGYGTFLGMIREGDFIKHDDDMDCIVFADRITEEQEEAYFDGLVKLGLFKNRAKIKRRSDNGRLLWTSMKETSNDTKCCTWYYQRYDKYYFHGKGRNWVTQKIGPYLNPPIDPTFEAIMKGIHAKFFDHMVERQFQGLSFMIPVQYGQILDYWYPNWSVPKKGGASLEEMLLVVPRWDKPKNWYLRRRK